MSPIQLIGRNVLLAGLTGLAISGCGGTKLLKEPEPLVVTQALASARDERIAVTLDWVIVRDGPGTWARKADWDEYLMRVENLAGMPLTLTNVTVYDSLETPLPSLAERKALVRASKANARRYKKHGTRIKAGRGTGTLLIAGATATAIGIGTAQVAVTSAALGGTAGGAAAAAGGLLLLGPALVVGGVVRGINNHAVDSEIGRRHSALPLAVSTGSTQALDHFFPIAPSPRRLEVHYTMADATEQVLVLDLQVALQGLHIETPGSDQRNLRD